MYRVTMRDEQTSETQVLDAVTLPEAIQQAKAACREWAEGGEWGPRGCEVCVHYIVECADEAPDEWEEEREGWVLVEVPADEDELIREAGGDPDCDHEWTGEGEGGIAENPGVWGSNHGGIYTRRHCSRCGVVRIEDTGATDCRGARTTVVRFEAPAMVRYAVEA